MNGSEHAFDDPQPYDDEASYAWLDEWLCEYVDGTMDPALEAVFEDYVEANPDLKTHVENLRETRALLTQSSVCKPKASKRACARVCGKVECEMLRDRASLAEVAQTPSLLFAGIASSVAVALLVGFFAGALYVGAPPSSASSLTPSSATTGPAVSSPVERNVRLQLAPRPFLLQSLVQRSPSSASSWDAGQVEAGTPDSLTPRRPPLLTRTP